MHPRAVEIGEAYSMEIRVRSTFDSEPGTIIAKQSRMEIRQKVRAIAHETDVAKVTLLRVPDQPGVAAAIFGPFGDAGIEIDIVDDVNRRAAVVENVRVVRHDAAAIEDDPRPARGRGVFLEPSGEVGFVGPYGAASGDDGVVLLARFQALLTRRLGGNPSAVTSHGSEFAVERHPGLQHYEWTSIGYGVNKDFVELA